ncbi:MAG: chorismate-binding protein, partial [Bacteroidota bacterium]|nr:chorismate-binding protein [Bacteroidota bacterium]
MSTAEQEYASFLDRLLEANQTFACFFEPLSSEPEIHIQQNELPKKIYSPDLLTGEEGFVFAPFHITKKSPAYLMNDACITKGFKHDNLIHINTDKNPINQDNNNSTTYTDYCSCFQEMMDEMESGRVKKVVLSRTLLVPHEPNISSGKLFLSLKKRYNGAYVYLVHIPEAGTWMGATPEVLLRGTKEYFTTISLAGTLKFQEQDSSSYNWGAKEIVEQDIVSAYIKNCLNESGLIIDKKTGPQTIIAGTVAHLKTEFNFRFPNYESNLGALINSLFPTPAVCGLPKNKSKEIILQTEKHDREFYSGFLGKIGVEQKTDLFVNLRCMKILP